MLTPARTRIGRVRMKNGGADVRVLHRDPDSRIVSAARDFVRDMERYEEPPTAYVAIAYWASDDETRRPHIIGWDTCDPGLTLPRLMAVASTQIADESAVLIAEHRVMRRLGYREEDPAS